MPITVKSAGDSARKWAQNAAGAAAEYAENAANAGQDWESGTVAAAGTFRAAVTAAGIERRYAEGARKAGAAKYGRKVREVGASRYSGGVSAGQADYQSGVEPYLQAIAGLTLPDRGPRGDAGNLRRVEVIATALHRRRIGASAAGR